MQLRTAQATCFFGALIEMKMFAFLLSQFHDAAKTAFTQNKALVIKQFYKDCRDINIDALKI